MRENLIPRPDWPQKMEGNALLVSADLAVLTLGAPKVSLH
jgi:hypothetical protein